MGGFRVVSPRNFSDFPGHSQLFLIRYADEYLVEAMEGMGKPVTIMSADLESRSQ